MNDKQSEVGFKALDKLKVELPSWGFANTGTRFGKFIQAGAATTIEEKFSDAAQVHAVTGAAPTLALHVLWDLPNGRRDVDAVEKLEQKFGIRAGSINPNIFQSQEYKYGSVGNPDPAIRRRAIDHILECVAIADALGARDVSPWFADGSNYPGTQNMRQRVAFFEEALKEIHSALKTRPALASRVQTIRAGLLSHRHRRLGNGVSVGQTSGAASLRLGRYRPSLPGPEHRADCCLAASSQDDRRLPL